MKYYTFRQNNSGGRFTVDDTLGHYVIIEAEDADHANLLAGRKGIYFDGCDTGYDCPCCGDRWYPVGESDANDTPKVYNSSLDEWMKDKEMLWWDQTCYVYHADGTKDVYQRSK